MVPLILGIPHIKSGYAQDLVAGAIEMPLARLDWGDLEMGQPCP